MDSDRGASDTDLAQDRQPTLLPDIVPVSIMDPPAVASSLTHSTTSCHAGWVPRVFTQRPLFTRTSILLVLLSGFSRMAAHRRRSQTAQERAVERKTCACNEPFSAGSSYIV